MFLRPDRRFFLITALLLLSVVVFAGNDPEYRQTLFGKNGQLQANTQVYTFDVNYEAYKNTPGAIEKTWYVKNVVSFMIDEESSWIISSNFTASIVLNITTENAAGQITNHPQKTLTVVYDKLQKTSTAISNYEFRDAVKMTVTIASAVTKNVAWDVTKNLKLMTRIIPLRDWSFNCTTAVTGIMTDSLFSDEWKVKWHVPLNFQTEYDVEWAWIDEIAIGNYTFNGVVNLDSIFESNATRVTTTNNHYRVPLLYEDNGRLYVRVRMAQKKVSGQRVEGSWSYLSEGGLAYLPRATGEGHEDNLNWQATTTFSESGNRQTVIQYYDGTLRGRQSVTKDNINRTTIVSESFYDYQGRAVIQVLPSPTLNTLIQFTKNLNQFDDARNAKTVYDKLDVSQSSCTQLTAKMLSTAVNSAAQYYSANNPLVNNGVNKYLPDAGGYPYSEIRYTADGTGRIDAQGDPGPLFQINSGRETKHYYESVDQEDLDALFGTDAGYASHYSKTWIRDANGQYSVSYKDMKGRIVATALAGDSAANLRALPSLAAATKTITRQLIDPETNNVHGNSILSSKSLMVAKQGNYQFSYTLSPEKLKMMLCTGTQFCFDCLYELRISIIPDCADKVIPGFTNPVVVKNFNLGEYLTSCAGNNSPLLSTSFNINLPEGSYTVVKELKLSTEARDWYRENVYLTNDTCKTKASFILQQYQLAVNQQTCHTGCAECTTKLGTEAEFINRFVQASGLPPEQIQAMMPEIKAAYAEALANCERLCDIATGESLDELNSLKEIMLQDMTPPMGQYARLNDTENPNNINKPYNIFNPTPSVTYCSPLKPSYQYPLTYNLNPLAISCALGYQNEYGIVNMTKEQAAGMNPETFTDNFEDSYAYNLLPYHPEFCKLQFAETNLKGTYRFGGKLQNTDTWAQAVSRGFVHTTTSNATLAADYLMQKDSFFMHLGSGHPIYLQMRNAITTNFIAANPTCGSPQLGMWQLAKYSVFCHKEIKQNSNQQVNINGCFPFNAALNACISQQNNLPPSSLNHCEADMNMAWKNFKALYLSLRNILISKYLTDNCTSINYTIFTTAGNNYQERFIRYSANPPYTIQNMADIGGMFGSNGNPGTFNSVSAAEAEEICSANSGTWMTRLRRCPQVEAMAVNNPTQWASDSTWLSSYLVKICSPGVDYMGHPFGASSLPDNKPPVIITHNPNGVAVSGMSVRNFPHLVTYYLNFRGISLSAFCYPELVDYPKAYNVAPATVSIPLVTAPEQCVCDRINYFKTKWQEAGSAGTFSSYLLNTQGTSIHQDTLDILINMCNSGYTSTNPNCNFLSEPLKIPAIFQCRGTASIDSSKTCITCTDYANLKAQFLSLRGVPAPYADPQNETEIAWNRAFAEFANYRTGFSKTWPEYVQFGIVCATNPTLTCNDLNNLVAAWQATNPPQGEAECRQSFVSFMNAHTGKNFTYDQWVEEFIRACGTPPPVCRPVVSCTTLQNIIYDYYRFYGYQAWRNKYCTQLFTAFVNDKLRTNYTYDEIISIYRDNCGGQCPPEPCTFPNSHLLTLLYNDFKTQYYQPGWDETMCRDMFFKWFNIVLGFEKSPYSWDQIVEIYTKYGECVPYIEKLCGPLYNCEQLNAIKTLFYEHYPNANSLGNCKELFTEFFNSQMNTNYTFEEIQQLYELTCFTSIGVCNDEGPSCKEMIVFTQTYEHCGGDECSCFLEHFNAHFNMSFGSYEQLQQYYLDHCGFMLNICPPENPEFNCDMLQATLSAFNKRYPKAGVMYGGQCQTMFVAFFNNTYSTQYTFDEINAMYVEMCGRPLQVCQNTCNEYVMFMGKYGNFYESMKIPLTARRQLFESLFNKTFPNAAGEESRFLDYEEIKSILGGCAVMPSGLEHEDRYVTLNDAKVLRNYKSAYYLRNPLGLPTNAQEDFTEWVNTTLEESKSPCELVELFERILGHGTGNIAFTEFCGTGGPLPPYPPTLCGLNVEIFNPPPVDTSNCHDPMLIAITDATIKWELYIDSLRNNFDVAWYNKCINAKNLESFTVSYQKAEYHYTLYKYDQAGQLVATIPPEGVDDRRNDAAFLASVKVARNTNAATPVRPSHTLATEYRYNTLGQVVQQKTPDGGLTKFWYDYLGRLVVSQNAQQALDGKYNYTVYDPLGRAKEVGQKPQAAAMTPSISRSESLLDGWLNNANDKEQVIKVVYDVAYGSTEFTHLLTQRNLRNRVSYRQVWNLSSNTHPASAIYYSYDIHGHVDTLLQDYGNSMGTGNIMNQAGHRFKRIAYDYDLVSGKMNLVSYQPGYINPINGQWVTNADRFYHQYNYDAANRLIDVYTSHDSITWERDAAYNYYKHGALSRTVIGELQVQGVDFAYTLQGWLKGVNSTSVNDGTYDIGGDGKIGSTNALVARDVFGFSLNYYRAVVSSVTIDDYKSINGTVSPFTGNVLSLTNTETSTVAKPLFNGSIASMMVNVPQLGVAQLYAYSYDQLDRIISMDAFDGFNNATNTWSGGAPVAGGNYKERISYDANGNIRTYVRNGEPGSSGVPMDNLTYQYEKNASGKIISNKLRYVFDAVQGNGFTEDIKTQTTLTPLQVALDNNSSQSSDNYRYDATGRLIKDAAEGITNITWSAQGRILSITKNGNTINYTYDASGNRLSKTANGKVTWYVRDAEGNVVSTYEQRSDLNSGHLTQSEIHLYGNSRIGVFNINRDMVNTPTGDITTFERGKKTYELANHLGHVLVTISDFRVQVDFTGEGQVDYFAASVITATDYYPFGMMMPGRNYNSSGYRYGFGGMEKNNEVKGQGNSYTTFFREYDPRLGRWISIDPKAEKYPGQSPFVAFNNNPIYFNDPRGDDPPAGWKKYTNTVDGKPIWLPKNVKVELYTAKNTDDKSLIGKIRAFTIHNTRFVGAFYPAHKLPKGPIVRPFAGYGNFHPQPGKGVNVYYKTPDVTLTSSSIGSGINVTAGTANFDVNAKYSVTGIPSGSGVKFVQTFVGDYITLPTQVPRGMLPAGTNLPVGTKVGNNSVFVDGRNCRNAPSVTHEGRPADNTNPYYVNADDGSTDVAQPGDVVAGGTTVKYYDGPTAVRLFTHTTFEVTIVITNYMNSGKDMPIGSFTYSYNSYGTTVTGGPTNSLQPQSTQSRSILKLDYGSYKYFDEK